MRLLISGILLACLIGAWWLGGRGVDDVTKAQVAPQQVENSNEAYIVTHNIISGDNLFGIATTIVLLPVLALLWLPKLRPHHLKAKHVMPLLLVGVGLLAACGPAEKEEFVEIGPNETAFVVPLLGDTSQQAQFQSVDFLRDHQVGAKLIQIPHFKRDMGRGWWEYVWEDSVKVIIVDRTPVTREWTRSGTSGTSPTNQAFSVESAESIDFQVGATCAALVEENNAAEFLYFFSGKSLSAVMDENVRGFIQARLFEKFGKLTLDEARVDKADIFEEVFTETRDHFATMGITISYLGGSEGLIYNDSHVQDEINSNFAAQQEEQRARSHATAQAVDNLRLIDEANTYATATVVAGRAAAQVLEDTGNQLDLHPSIVDYTLAQRSQGYVPDTLIITGDQSSQLPFGFFLNGVGGNGGSSTAPLPTPTPLP